MARRLCSCSTSDLEEQSRTGRKNSEKLLTTSPRKDAVRMSVAPSGKRIANAKPMMVPCAVTALMRSGLTLAHTGFAGHGQSISIVVGKRVED